MENKNTRRGFTQINGVGQALPDNAPHKRHFAAFTLIELLVVVLIIGILAAVAVPQYKVAVAKSKLHAILPIVKAMVEAEEAYYLANGEYTRDAEKLDMQIPAECAFIEAYTWACGKDFMIKFGNPPRTKGFLLSYCPGANMQPWNECCETRDYQFTYYYSRAEQEKTMRCVPQNNSSLGERVCNSFN